MMLSSEKAWLESVTRPRKILLVEDEPLVRAVFLSILSRYNADVIEAADGEEAIRLYRENHPDVVFLDLKLPIVSGFEVFAYIRQQSKTVPVLVVAGEISERTIDRLYAHGYCHLVRKPFDVNVGFIDAILSPLFLQKLPDTTSSTSPWPSQL